MKQVIDRVERSETHRGAEGDRDGFRCRSTHPTNRRKHCRHCERSEAIHVSVRRDMDCFVLRSSQWRSIFDHSAHFLCDAQEM